METEKRNSTRFKEIGKITSQELCALPGILDDISASGLKVHYAFPVVVDLENEYELKISPFHGSNTTPMNLICTPQWVKEHGGNTFIGFSIQYSPDAHKLQHFIKHLESISRDAIPDII